MPFLTTASQMFSLAPIYFSNLILKQNAFSIIPQCPHGTGHTFISLFTRNQLPKMQVEQKHISNESKYSQKVKHRIYFFSDTSPSFSHLSHPEPQSRRNHRLRPEKAAVISLCPQYLNTFSLVLGHQKGLEGSRAGSVSLQERAVKYGLTGPGKGRCTMNCPAAPAYSTQTLTLAAQTRASSALGFKSGVSRVASSIN